MSSYHFEGPAPHIRCADGFVISIQAHPELHCSYADNKCTQLTKVEIACKPTWETASLPSDGGFTSPEMRGWECFGYVPVETVKQMLKNHGGVSENFEHLPAALQDPELDKSGSVAAQWETCLGVPL